jgi:actin-related protein
VPNCTAKPKSEKRLYVGDEVDELRDISAVSLRRPVDRGFLVNGPLEKDIWERTLRRTLKVRPRFIPSSRRKAAALPRREPWHCRLTLRRRRWTPRNTRCSSRSRSSTCRR